MLNIEAKNTTKIHADLIISLLEENEIISIFHSLKRYEFNERVFINNIKIYK